MIWNVLIEWWWDVYVFIFLFDDGFINWWCSVLYGNFKNWLFDFFVVVKKNDNIKCV